MKSTCGPRLLCPTTGPLTEVVLDAHAYFRARGIEEYDTGDELDGEDDEDYADRVLRRNTYNLAYDLQMFMEACGDVFAFELTGIATERPVLAWRRWPCAGTCEYDAAREAHARSRAWAWRAIGRHGTPGLWHFA